MEGKRRLAARQSVAVALALLIGDADAAAPYVEHASLLAAAARAAGSSLHATTSAWIELYGAFEHWRNGKVEPALREIERVAATIETMGSTRGDHLARCVGLSFLTLGKLRAAERSFRQVRSQELRMLYMAILAFAEEDMGRFKENLVAYADSPTLKVPFAGYLMSGLGRPAQGRELIQLGRQNTEGWRLLIEAEATLARGSLAESIALFEEGLAQLRLLGDPAYFLGSESLARAYRESGDSRKSIKVLEDASRERKRAYPLGRAVAFGGMSGYFWIRVQERLAELYRETGREEEAQAIESELRKLLALADSDHPILARIPQGTTPTIPH